MPYGGIKQSARLYAAVLINQELPDDNPAILGWTRFISYRFFL